MPSAISSIVRKYEKVRSIREPKMRKFLAGEECYILLQQADRGQVFFCRTPEESLAANLLAFEAELNAPGDQIPFLEPWFGTGVYANAFGCPYVWRENESPAVHYRCHSIAEVREVEKPDWQESEICRLVMKAIRFFKERTGSQLPIALTDTQSAFDTATLILDAAELFAACHEEPQTVKHFLEVITDVIVDFSRAQIEQIGERLVARPGHLMPSVTGARGISISDDNFAVASPTMNRDIAFPSHRRLAEVFGGVAVHSCGPWTQTMAMFSRSEGVLLAECAVSKDADPTPCKPEAVRDAMRGKGIPVKVRLGTNDPHAALPLLQGLFARALPVAVEIPLDQSPEKANENYAAFRQILEALALAHYDRPS